MDIKLSVIVPVYNTKEYLEKCIDSIVAQTMDNMEILLVDDGSTDGSGDVLKQYEKNYPEKIKVFIKENGGQASARNLALSYARGEYVGFIDSDDWIDEDMYKQMYQKAVDNNADIVICDMVDHYPTEVIYHNSSVFEDKFKVTPSACNKIFRRSFIGDTKFPVGLWYEDFEFTTKQLMKTNNIQVIHEGFYHCHCRAESTMTNNNSEKNKDMLTVLEHLEKFVNDNEWNQKYSEVLEYLYMDHVLITTINRLEEQENKKKREVIKVMYRTVRSKYPHFYKDKVFKEMPRNRKIIALLNAYGFSQISKIILHVKRGK